MSGGRALAIAAVACALGCAAVPAVARDPIDVDWRKVATGHDRERLRNWRTAWVTALTQVRAAKGGAEALAADPALFDPDRVLAGARLAPGPYRCRVFRLGGTGVDARPIASSPWTRCRVAPDADGVAFTSEGAQRASGHLFESTDARTVFLGTLALGDEDRPMRYGRDARRDMAGVIERIGERRWRLLLPFPGFASTLNVVDLVPE